MSPDGILSRPLLSHRGFLLPSLRRCCFLLLPPHTSCFCLSASSSSPQPECLSTDPLIFLLLCSCSFSRFASPVPFISRPGSFFALSPLALLSASSILPCSLPPFSSPLFPYLVLSPLLPPSSPLLLLPPRLSSSLLLPCSLSHGSDPCLPHPSTFLSACACLALTALLLPDLLDRAPPWHLSS